MTIHNKKLKIARTLVLLVFTMIALSVFFLSTTTEYAKADEQIYNQVISTKDITPDYLKEIEQIAYEVANEREYERGIHDCTEYSKELVKRLKEEKYNAEYVYGQYLKKSYWRPLHNWVIVYLNNKEYPIEATSGNIINEEKYAQKYKEIKRGICP